MIGGQVLGCAAVHAHGTGGDGLLRKPTMIGAETTRGGGAASALARAAARRAEAAPLVQPTAVAEERERHLLGFRCRLLGVLGRIRVVKLEFEAAEN